ncbi:ketopantoate reductase [Aggregicoccus sp. 17bor-14]|uniref:ketopantoate reductase family protein n=1 Tax=Myxococcaceae TaxID=31 RepID=UPI00129C3FA2|nr:MULTISPECIES: 2-dehydropantoate 2-reductase N-terminal domain-containing protein [Myxococcaceae]MBF5042150.1 ketopantoate reductase [Simulacricoccus sp. 17bor-14]MRI87927.1 ketopantoate reductase [Aggregicoccus sp. 17bor-14]
MHTSPRVLLVGAGAVGQVYARFLKAGGCEVSFLVKESHAAEAREGFTLHAHRGRSLRTETLQAAQVLTSPEQVRPDAFEQVWLCVSSTALRAGGWVEALAARTGEATWVMVQPALEDRAFLLQHVPAERLVTGAIPFLSYAAPLAPGASPSSGTAYWFPPLARGAFSGPAARRDAVVRALRAGGYPASRSRDAGRAVAVPAGVLTAFVAGLELSGWRFAALLEPSHLALTHAAAREAARAAAARTGASARAVLALLRPGVFRLLPRASRLVPFDLETYLRVHFTKVGAQNRLMLGEYVRAGREAGLEVAHLESLLSRLQGTPQ